MFCLPKKFLNSKIVKQRKNTGKGKGFLINQKAFL